MASPHFQISVRTLLTGTLSTALLCFLLRERPGTIYPIASVVVYVFALVVPLVSYAYDREKDK